MIPRLAVQMRPSLQKKALFPFSHSLTLSLLPFSQSPPPPTLLFFSRSSSLFFIPSLILYLFPFSRFRTVPFFSFDHLHLSFSLSDFHSLPFLNLSLSSFIRSLVLKLFPFPCSLFLPCLSLSHSPPSDIFSFSHSPPY
jgi:hypothetical protein